MSDGLEREKSGEQNEGRQVESSLTPACTGSTDIATEEQVWQTRYRSVLAAATSDNTRRTYQSAVRHFQTWGGHLPAKPDDLIRYLIAYGESLNPRTLALRVTALSQWHVYQGFPDPAPHPDVRKTVRGLQRLHGKPKRKAKALPIEDLERMARMLNTREDLSSLRDNALIQVAFFGAFRRSEVVSLCVSQLAWETEGLVVMLSRSKTDQEGEGLVKAIPYGDPQGCCPVSALRRWLTAARISEGALFKRITRWGTMGTEPLHPGSVNEILARRASEAGLNYVPELSSHSFRRGLATSAHQAGADFLDIKRQGGWRHDGTVHGYIEEAERFTSNAATVLLKRSEKMGGESG